ncbi:hypothetical protein LELG_03773 [Lodderomyces elongisporus NRRL YB-4239]|uniref:Restriction of telomere capping protein 4 n=1 Tax=Lodderomyces elongisporus (strain ATCC 11503 / CBS 2605 / JCM 1781 / NBRC 1676 / NRRL YB-4239) TaxID=379508 RepID=A5E2D6_LODEL|nr:hypothetical protein LELG_03773 [Lodderomyces elongisporus NRRL YB-4239]
MSSKYLSLSYHSGANPSSLRASSPVKSPKSVESRLVPPKQEQNIIIDYSPKQSNSKTPHIYLRKPKKSKKPKSSIAIHHGDGKYKELNLAPRNKQLPDTLLGGSRSKEYPSSFEVDQSIDADEQLGIIDLGKIMLSPIKGHDLLKDVKLDGLLEVSDDDDDSGGGGGDHDGDDDEQFNGDRRNPARNDTEDKDKTISRPKRKEFGKNTKLSNLVVDFHTIEFGDEYQIREKYRKLGLLIPKPITSRKELIDRANEHLKVIPKILAGKVSPSIYYEMAKNQCRKSLHEIMSASDIRRIDWKAFYSGYYGHERQSIIGSYIENVCYEDLVRCAKYNKTVTYWSISQFATQVLANEIIIRMIRDDMHYSFKEAEAFCQKSVDYGVIIADEVPIMDDLSKSNKSLKKSSNNIPDSLLDKTVNSNKRTKLE